MKKITLLLLLFLANSIVAQVANQPNDLIVCDDDNDGIFCFDLSFQNSQILGSQNPVDYTITYHATQADADSGFNPLPITYCNTSSVETIFVRLEDNASGGVMSDTTSFELIVNLTPTISGSANLDLFLCDELGVDDGFTMFDLTINEAQIFGTQSPSEFILGYYETQQNAIIGTNQLSNPSSYTNSIPYVQEIWIRLSNTITGCSTVGSFNIVVIDNPILTQPTPLEVCDDDVDEITFFNLTTRESEIVGTQTGVSLQYFETASDLANNIPIANPTVYQNIQNPQTVYIRGTNLEGCSTDVTLTIRVLPIPTPNMTPSSIEACDDNTDGILTLDLTVREAQILDGEANVTVSYHTTDMDAIDGISPIADPTMYTADMANANFDGEVIVYVRVESDLQIDSNLEPCFAVVELPVAVLSLPVLTSSSYDYVFCEYDNDNVGQFNWDEVTASLNLLSAPQNINDFTVTYHRTVSDAMNNTAALGNGYENTTDPQTVFIRVTDIITGCYNGNNIASLQLSVENRPQAIAPFAYEECADDQSSQGTATFDLTSLDGQIIGGQSNVSVSYYETANDAMTGVNAISSASSYNNIANPQTVYATTRSIFTGCFSDPVLVTLRVNPLPVVELPEDTIRCVDNTGTLINPFDIGTNLGPGISYSWTTPSGMSSSPIVLVNEPGTYSVTITDNNSSTSCSYSDSITIGTELQPCPLSVEEVNASTIKIFPNPVKDILMLQAEASTQIERLEIYSLHGKRIHEQNVSIGNEEITIDVHNFSSGFYILKIQTKEKGTLTKRFVVE